MTTRRRTLLFTCALGFGAALLPITVAGAAPAQDGGASFGGVGQETSTTLAPSTTATSEATSETNQTLVESEDTPDQPLFTENRKVAAVIGGLVFVALALLLLTIRYVRVTKPVPVAPEEGLPMLPPTLELNDESIFVVASEDTSKPPEPIPTATAPIWAPPPALAPGAAEAAIETPTTPAGAVGTAALGTDHDAADDDWEPRTGEQERVEIPTGSAMARPGVGARRKALGLDA